MSITFAQINHLESSTNKKLFQKKHDEWYTEYKSIEYHINLFLSQFSLKDKIIFCPCDNPTFSQFIKYFQNNKGKICYKKLLFNYLKVPIQHKFGKEYPEGDFRSEESIEMLKECDVVITNPPFSLIGEFYDLIKKYKKDFLIIAPLLFCCRKNARKDFVNRKITICENTNYHYFFVDNNGKRKEINCMTITNYNFKSKRCFIFTQNNNFNKTYLDNTDIINIEDGENIPDCLHGTLAVSVSQISKVLADDRIELLCFSQDYGQKLTFNGKNIFSKLIVKKK